MTSARKQEKVPPADGDQNLTESKNLSAPQRQKSRKTLTFPKGSINTSSSRQIYRADSKDSYFLVFMSL